LSFCPYVDTHDGSTLSLHERFVNEPAGDLDAPLIEPRDGATSGVDLERPFYLLPVFIFGGEVDSLFDLLEDEHLVFCI